MNLTKYWIFTSLKTFILWPLWLGVNLRLLAYGLMGYYGSYGMRELIALMGYGEINKTIFLLLAIIASLALLALPYAIYRFGKKAALPDTFLSRYGPFIAPIILTIVAWLLLAFIVEGHFSKGNISVNPLTLLAFSAFLPSEGGFQSEVFWFAPIFSILAIVSSIVSYLFFMTCFAVGTWRGKCFATRESKKALYALALIFILASAATVQGYVHYHSVLRPDHNYPELKESVRSPYLFSSLAKTSGLISPKTPPSLQIDQDYPRLIGVNALIPVYAAAAEAIYRKSEETDRDVRREAVQSVWTLPTAYQMLLNGQADIMFADAPSEKDVKEAAKRGLTFTITPIAKEAFVFLVNEQNPVKNLSIEQIRDIYSGKINDWREVGGAPGKIMPFQRSKESGSQAAMLRNVMRGMPMRKPLEVEPDEMYGFYECARRLAAHVGISAMTRLFSNCPIRTIVPSLAEYRNIEGAIGYSFRYYATVMNTIPGIRLLEIDGIAPTAENIRNGSYPFTDDFYMITAHPLSENAQKLHDWFLSDEGQQLIEDVGYVPIRNISR